MQKKALEFIKGKEILKKIQFADRIFWCECGYIEDRDIKAAKTVFLHGASRRDFLHLKFMNKGVIAKWEHILQDQLQLGWEVLA